MTPRETVLLTRYVKACCPQQAIDEYTPDAWFDLLGDLNLIDCRRAVAEVGKRQPFVAPAEIRAEVRRLREALIPDRSQLPSPGADLADHPVAWEQALKDITRRLGDGRMPFYAIPSGADGGGAVPSGEYRGAREAEVQTVRARRRAEHEAERELTRAYFDAQDRLLALGQDVSDVFIAQAHSELFSDAEAAAGFPKATSAVGATERQKIVILAAYLAGSGEKS
jgi:hypothetical protein